MKLLLGIVIEAGISDVILIVGIGESPAKTVGYHVKSLRPITQRSGVMGRKLLT